jgi:hypothetical protein
MDSHRFSVFAAAFLGAISASLVSFLFTSGAADPRAAASPAGTVSPMGLSEKPIPGVHTRSSAGLDDGPIDDCEQDELCDSFDGNDPIEV